MKKVVNTKHGNTSLFTAVLMALVVFFLCCGLFSCSAKKKNLEKTKTDVHTETSSDSSGTSKTKSTIKTEGNTAVKQVEKSSEVEYSGAPGDSLTVTEKDSQGKVVKETTYKGSGKLKTKTEEKQTDTAIAEYKQENTEAETKAQVKKKKAEAATEASKKLHVEAKGVSFGFWIWLSLAVIIGIILFYLNYRFKWLKRVTEVFNK